MNKEGGDEGEDERGWERTLLGWSFLIEGAGEARGLPA